MNYIKYFIKTNKMQTYPPTVDGMFNYVLLQLPTQVRGDFITDFSKDKNFYEELFMLLYNKTVDMKSKSNLKMILSRLDLTMITQRLLSIRDDIVMKDINDFILD